MPVIVFIVDQIGNVFDQSGLIDVIGNFIDDELLPVCFRS